MRSHYMPIRMVNISNTTMPNGSKVVEQQELFIAGRNAK